LRYEKKLKAQKKKDLEDRLKKREEKKRDTSLPPQPNSPP
jgi:hypothetical protein